jgi:hypothetical protein
VLPPWSRWRTQRPVSSGALNGVADAHTFRLSVEEADVPRYVRLATTDGAPPRSTSRSTGGHRARSEVRRSEGARAACTCGCARYRKSLATREELHPGKTKDDWFYREAWPSIASIAAFAASFTAFDGARTAEVTDLGVRARRALRQTRGARLARRGLGPHHDVLADPLRGAAGRH